MSKKNRHGFVEVGFEWLKSKPKLSEASRKSYKGEINRLAEYFANIGMNDVSAISRDAWWGYLECINEHRSLIDTKRCNELRLGSIKQARRITRDFFLWALDEGIISWVPRIPDEHKVVGTKLRPAPRGRIGIDTEVARILVGDCKPDDITECRAYMVFNLVFWGTLKPAALSELKVEDLSDTGVLKVWQSSRLRQVEMPDHVAELWQTYRETRRLVTGTMPTKTAPLICHIENELPLSAWGVWSVFNEWHKMRSTPDCNKLSPRDLRASYLEFICDDGELRLKLACTYGGIMTKHVTAWDGEFPDGMISAVNGQIRENLQARI